MKFKLSENTIQKAAIFSSALALNPIIAYAQTQNTNFTPVPIAGYTVLMSGFALAIFTEIKKIERERLYELHENLIPSQTEFISFLKKERKTMNSKNLEYEISAEKTFLESLKEEEKVLCDKFKIDKNDDEQMEAFIEKVKKREKSKVKSLLSL